MAKLGAIIGFVESFPGSLQLLVHGQQVLDSGELPGILTNQEHDILHLHATLSSDRHGFVGHFRDKLDHQVLKNIHRLCIRVLVVSKPVHHAPELLGEKPLSLAVSDVHPAGPVLHLLIEARLVLLIRHSAENTRKRSLMCEHYKPLNAEQ